MRNDITAVRFSRIVRHLLICSTWNIKPELDL